MKNVLYIAEYSPENIMIGKILGKNVEGKSSFALWLNEIAYKSQEDFESIMGNSEIENFYIIKSKPNKENFISGLINYIISQEYEPTDIFIRGYLDDIWPIGLALESFLVSTKLHIILEGLEMPLDDFEKKTLDRADTIFSMGPMSNVEEYSKKTIQIFEKFNSSIFVKIPDYMLNNIDRRKVKLSILSGDNFDASKTSDNGISYINSDVCPEKELAIYMLLAGFVVNESGKNEIDILINKMGKAKMSNFDKKEEGYAADFTELENESLEEFAEFIVEKMLKTTSIKKGETIRGHEII